MAYSKGSLVLSEVTIDDLPVLSAMFPRVYHNTPFYAKMMPDTPAIEEWWKESDRNALLDPRTRFANVTDEDTPEVVAMVRWVLPRDNESP
jgi:hypothetical protein